MKTQVRETVLSFNHFRKYAAKKKQKQNKTKKHTQKTQRHLSNFKVVLTCEDGEKEKISSRTYVWELDPDLLHNSIDMICFCKTKLLKYIYDFEIPHTNQ